MKFSKRIESIKPSATLKAKAKVEALQKKGIQVISFTAGEPLFDTPTLIKEAAKEAIDHNWTRYTPIAGLLELREAICRKLKRDNHLDYSPNAIIVGCGAKQSIYVALQVLIDDGEEVLIPSPFWVTYPEQILAAGGKPKVIATQESNQFKLTAEELEKAITPKSKLLIMNNPNNPTGAVYSKEELQAIGKICLKHHLPVLTDEIYEKLIFDGLPFYSFAEANPDMKPLTLTVNGLSKTYAMTGWRVGYTAGPLEVIQKMEVLQSQEITCIPAFIQRAAIVALEKTEKEMKEFLFTFQKQREAMVEVFKRLPGVTFVDPQGAFYVFANLQVYLGKKWKGQTLKNSEEINDFLLEEAHVGATDGEAFGGPVGTLRFSFAIDAESIKEGMNRVESALRKLQ